MGAKRRSRKSPPVDTQKNRDMDDFGKRLSEVIITNGFLNKFEKFTGFSLFCYLVSLICDIYLIYKFINKGQYWYTFLVCAFWLNASLQIGKLSYSLYNNNGNQFIPRDLLPPESFFSWALKWVCPILFMGLLPRYIDIFKYIWKSKSENDNDKKHNYFVAMIWEYGELIKLNQCFAFMKSACQLTLKWYIILSDKQEFKASSAIFSICPVISLSLSLVSYDKHICFMKGIYAGEQNESSGISMDYKMSPTDINNIINTNRKDMAFQLAAHYFWIVSRLIAFSFFAIGYGWIFFPIVSIHMVGVFIWHYKQKYGIMASMRLSFLHLFAYLYPLEKESDKMKHPRLSPAWYLPVFFFQNIILMFLSKFHVISSDLSYPWNEWQFFAFVQLATMISNCFLFWRLNKKRQQDPTNV